MTYPRIAAQIPLQRRREHILKSVPPCLMISSDPHSRQRVRRTRLALFAFALIVCVLFLIANRGVYRGFFSNNDFAKMANARSIERPLPIQRVWRINPR
jgi:hypothetical protein